MQRWCNVCGPVIDKGIMTDREVSFLSSTLKDRFWKEIQWVYTGILGASRGQMGKHAT